MDQVVGLIGHTNRRTPGVLPCTQITRLEMFELPPPPPAGTAETADARPRADTTHTSCTCDPPRADGSTTRRRESRRCDSRSSARAQVTAYISKRLTASGRTLAERTLGCREDGVSSSTRSIWDMREGVSSRLGAERHDTADTVGEVGIVERVGL